MASRPRDDRATGKHRRAGPHASAEDVEPLIRNALDHLHDLPYLQRHPLAERLGTAQRDTLVGRALQQVLLEAVESLQPRREVSPESHAWRTYQLLHLRYVEALDVSTVCSRLSIGRREYFRDQRRAVQALALILQERLAEGEAERGVAGESGATREVRPAGEFLPRLAVLPGPKEMRTNLPLSLTSLVGRERELAEVKRALGTTRLLTLTGSGGVGKTRLAREIASELLELEEFSDGVWWVDLALIADPSLVPPSVAAALGLLEQAGYPILSTLIDYLRPKRCILVLDNCEHLVEASARLVVALLQACPSLTVLATSREALRIEGETTYQVPPLSVPDAEHLPALGELGRYGSIRLFAERAASASPGFELTVANAQAVTQICSRLDGLPLAIELAAARIRVLSPEEIARRVDDRFRLLTSGSRTALPRQQTLRATLDWSHDLLDQPEQMLFRRLAVFVGGFRAEAAEAICSGGKSGSRIEPGEVFDLLARLLEKSLALAEDRDGQTRYRLLETVREYASGKLEESGEADDVRARHLDWYLELAERGEPELRGHNQLTWLARFLDELGNFRAALDWARTRESVEAELRWVAALAWFWIWQGYETESAQAFASTLPKSEGHRSATRAQVLLWSGLAEYGRGRPDAAKERSEQALAIAREVGDERLIALSLVRLAFATGLVGTPDEALTYLNEALPLARRAGAKQELALILSCLAEVRTRQGDEEGAWESIKESLAVVREHGDKLHGSLIANELGLAALKRGELALARDALEQGFADARDIGYEMGAIRGVLGLGDLARAEGDHRRAESLYRDGISSASAARRWILLATGLGRLAGLRLEQGQPRTAARLYGALDSWYASVGMHAPYKPHPSHERDLAAAHAALEDGGVARAWAEGQAMTLEQAVEYALSDTDTS